MNKQIGRALGTTERTIKAHRHRVMEKMQVQTLAELVSLAERVGVFVSATRIDSLANQSTSFEPLLSHGTIENLPRAKYRREIVER